MSLTILRGRLTEFDDHLAQRRVAAFASLQSNAARLVFPSGQDFTNRHPICRHCRVKAICGNESKVGQP